MQIIHADKADLHFFSNSAESPKYFLVYVDFFTSKTYPYGMKKKKTTRQVICNTESLREYLKGEIRHKMRLQTDQEFNQNETAEINRKYKFLHYNSKLNERRVMDAEQKIRELKSHPRNFKKRKKGNLKPTEALKKITNNMNMLPTRKYRMPPEEVEKESLESEECKLDYDIKRLKKVDKDAARYSRYGKKEDKKN